MNDKKYNEKLSLDIPFDEALERFGQSDPKEMLEAQKEDMPDGIIEDLIDAFEACSNFNDEGQQFWYARDMQKLLEYAKWENFEQVISKAMNACEKSGQNVDEHWLPDVRKSISGKGREDEILDYKMSRYACYLVTQNADPRKRPDKYLSSAAKDAGVITPQEFSIFHSKGYKGLYGKTVPEIRRHKGLAKSANILDRMGSTELAANFFRVTQTEEKLRNEGIQGKERAYDAHYEVGRQVRDAMLKISGIAPEDLLPVDNINQAVKRLKEMDNQTTVVSPEDAPDEITAERELPTINLNADLWKYALLIMVQKPGMLISTKDLISDLPNYISIPDGVEKVNSSY